MNETEQETPIFTVARNSAQGSRDHVVGILLVALVARLLVLWLIIARYPHNWIFTRGIEMGLLAQSILSGQGLGSPFVGYTGPTAFFAPAYPGLIALVFRVFGSYSFASEIVIVLLQILVSLLTIWLMMHIARQTMGQRTANIAGAIWAVSIPLLGLPIICWDTSITICVLTGLIALALRCMRGSTMSDWVTLGAYCGCAALINPALMPSLLAVFAWVAWRTRKTLRVGPAVGLAVLLVIFAPWPIRNARVFHAFIPLRSTVGYDMWVGNHAGASGYIEDSMFPTFNKQELDDYISRGEVGYTRNKAAIAKAYIRAHPAEFVRLTALRFVRFWTGSGNMSGSIFYLLHACLTTCLGTAGLILVLRKRRYQIAVLLLLPLILFPVPYYLTHAEFRFRIVIDPLLTILGAYALTWFIARLPGKSTPAAQRNVDRKIGEKLFCKTHC